MSPNDATQALVYASAVYANETLRNPEYAVIAWRWRRLCEWRDSPLFDRPCIECSHCHGEWRSRLGREAPRCVRGVDLLVFDGQAVTCIEADSPEAARDLHRCLKVAAARGIPSRAMQLLILREPGLGIRIDSPTDVAVTTPTELAYRREQVLSVLPDGARWEPGL